MLLSVVLYILLKYCECLASKRKWIVVFGKFPVGCMLQKHTKAEVVEE